MSRMVESSNGISDWKWPAGRSSSKYPMKIGQFLPRHRLHCIAEEVSSVDVARNAFSPMEENNDQ